MDMVLLQFRWILRKRLLVRIEKILAILGIEAGVVMSIFSGAYGLCPA